MKGRNHFDHELALGLNSRRFPQFKEVEQNSSWYNVIKPSPKIKPVKGPGKSFNQTVHAEAL